MTSTFDDALLRGFSDEVLQGKDFGKKYEELYANRPLWWLLWMRAGIVSDLTALDTARDLADAQENAETAEKGREGRDQRWTKLEDDLRSIHQEKRHDRDLIDEQIIRHILQQPAFHDLPADLRAVHIILTHALVELITIEAPDRFDEWIALDKRAAALVPCDPTDPPFSYFPSDEEEPYLDDELLEMSIDRQLDALRPEMGYPISRWWENKTSSDQQS
jgi:hypothetical protein